MQQRVSRPDLVRVLVCSECGKSPDDCECPSQILCAVCCLPTAPVRSCYCGTIEVRGSHTAWLFVMAQRALRYLDEAGAVAVRLAQEEQEQLALQQFQDGGL